MTRRFIKLVVMLMVAFALFGVGWVAGSLGFGSTVNRASLSDLERQFADLMKGSVLVGRFIGWGREDRQLLERYEISSAEKIGPDAWRFNARIKYGSVDVQLPLVLPLHWAGDTPMITMTDVTIPALGTFSARVFFYGDGYAGTWQHGAVGGWLFGKIEKT